MPPEAPDQAPELAQPLTAFTPVPRQKDRSDGWKPEVQRAFIEALADTGSVASACRMVERSPNSAYALRRHPQGGEFNAAWIAAQGHGVRRLHDAVLDRALNGVEVPIVAYGEIVGSYRKYDNRLAAFILRNRLPEQFGEDRPLHAIDRKKLERLKREWREEWEEERRAADKDDEDSSVEALDAFFEDLRQRRLANEAIAAEREEAEMSERERAAWAEYQRIRAEERGETSAAENDDDPATNPEPKPSPQAAPDPGPSAAAPPESEPAPASLHFPVSYNPAHGPPPWAQRMR